MSYKQMNDLNRDLVRLVLVIAGFFGTYIFYEKMEQIGYVYNSVLRMEVKVLELEESIKTLKQTK